MLKILITAWFLLLFSVPGNGKNMPQIDLSEKIIKLNENIIHSFGAKGFGIYDKGERKFKIFNWNFEITSEIPLAKGEAPFEIKNIILTTSLANDKLFLYVMGDNKIKIFDIKGSFIQCKTFGITPRKILYKKNKLYLFNFGFNLKEKASLLAKIIDPGSESLVKEIFLSENILSKKIYKQETFLTGLSSFFDIDDNNHIYLLNGYENAMFEIDETGKLIRKMDLPYKNREKRWVEKIDNNYETFVSSLDLYTGMEIFENIFYVTFLKTIKKDKKTGITVYRTYVLKMIKNGKHTEKVFDGELVILGKNRDTLYLFNFDDYHVILVDLSVWK